MQIEWHARFAVGNDQIDNQHKQLLDYYNRFSEACTKGTGKAEVVRLFGFLDNYVQQHFAAEEALMEQSRYPLAPKHKVAHMDLKRSVAELRGQLQGDSVPLSTVIDASRVLIKWVLEHIGKEDVALGKHLAVRQAS